MVRENYFGATWYAYASKGVFGNIQHKCYRGNLKRLLHGNCGVLWLGLAPSGLLCCCEAQQADVESVGQAGDSVEPPSALC